MREEGTRLTLAHPWTYAGIHIQGILRTLSGVEAHTYIRLLKLFHGTENGWQELITQDLLDTIRHNSNELTHAAILTIAGLGLIMMLVYLFASVALFSKKLPYTMPVVCSLWVVVYWLVITGGPHGYGRYRHAVMPIICVLAGYGLHLILSRFRHMSHDGGLLGTELMLQHGQILNPIFAKPSFERIEIDSIPDEQLAVFPDRIIHQTRPWIRFLESSLGGEPILAVLRENGRILGYFTGLIVKEFGFKILGSPFPGWSTTYMGFNLLPGIPRALALEALADFAFNELKCDHLELMDRYLLREDATRLGFEIWDFSTLEVDLAPSEDEIFSVLQASMSQLHSKSRPEWSYNRGG